MVLVQLGGTTATTRLGSRTDRLCPGTGRRPCFSRRRSARRRPPRRFPKPRNLIKPHCQPTRAGGTGGKTPAAAPTAVGPNRDRRELGPNDADVAGDELRHPLHDDCKQLDHRRVPRHGVVSCCLIHRWSKKHANCCSSAPVGRRGPPKTNGFHTFQSYQSHEKLQPKIRLVR
jgi:hypothetical protein